MILHSIVAGKEQFFGPAAVMEQLDIIKQIREPATLERDVFVRPSGHYYITSDYID